MRKDLVQNLVELVALLIGCLVGYLLYTRMSWRVVDTHFQNSPFHIVPLLLAYLVLARMAIRSRTRLGMASFAVLNLVGFLKLSTQLTGAPQIAMVTQQILYIVIVCCHYFLVRRYAGSLGKIALIPIIMPVIVLIVIKLLSLLTWPRTSLAGAIINMTFMSYLAFRLSYLALEVRNRIIPMPIFAEHFSYAFFFPIMPVGPISRYSLFHRSLKNPQSVPLATCATRILVGLTKYFFLSNIINSVSFDGLLFDGHPHGIFDLFISSIAYYLYLYLNFSGFCDIVIGLSGILGIAIEENFDRPFHARCVKDFWNHWHITLSTYLRDILFAPLSKWLAGGLGPGQVQHAVGITLFVVFLVIGMWHGLSMNFILFGVMHGGAVACNHYYNLMLKKYLGLEHYKAYMRNRIIQAVATTLTFLYVSISFLFFANSMEKIMTLVEVIR
ncbi:MAG: MBOAT family protein [Magnetococcales bacterium]|nr:MBOAT family protein [Magnetococcales bacterium]